MKEKKTIKEWFNTLEEPHRTEALRSSLETEQSKDIPHWWMNMYKEVYSLRDAILMGIVWGDDDYNDIWREMTDDLYRPRTKR